MVLEIIVGGLFFAHLPGCRGTMCRLSLSLLGGRKRVRKGPIFKGEMVPDKSGRNYLQWKILNVLGINARVFGKWPARNVLGVFAMQWGSKVCISIICDRYRTCNIARNRPGQKWSHLEKNGNKLSLITFGPHINAQRVDIVGINVL